VQELLTSGQVVGWFALVLGLAIRRGLRPLRALSDEVHALDVRRAEPLPPRARHQEFGAVVAAINTLVARYHAALERERQLASELAHELRTPLSSLSLHARSLQHGLPEAERQASLRRIEHDALRAGQLLNQLLALARASRTELAEAAAELDLAALARHVVADSAPAALAAAHELALEAPDAWRLRGHPVLLETALRNLIDNALAHTPTGTLVEAQLDPQAGWLQVCDNGGLQPATQAGPAGAGHSLGLGLGHRVVDKVAQVHGGRFRQAEAPPGFSTCYRIELPLATA